MGDEEKIAQINQVMSRFQADIKRLMASDAPDVLKSADRLALYFDAMSEIKCIVANKSAGVTSNGGHSKGSLKAMVQLEDLSDDRRKAVADLIALLSEAPGGVVEVVKDHG